MDVRFADLVDLADLQQIMKLLYEVTKIPHGLVGSGHTILHEVGWQDACALFHRDKPQSAARCESSNLALNASLKFGDCVGHRCLNGLMDYATPIVIGGQHLATIFVGQLLHERPDVEFFRSQAQTFGFDEEAYLTAIQRLPIVSREQVDALMSFYALVARILANKEHALMRLQSAEQQLLQNNQQLQQRVNEQTRELAEKNQRLQEDILQCARIESALKQEQAKLQNLLDASPVGVGWSSIDGRIEYVNHRFTELFGYRLEDIPTVQDWYHLAYPDLDLRRTLIEPWAAQVEASRHTGVKPPELDVLVRCKEGTQKRVLINVSWVNGRRLANFSDITERWLAEQRENKREHTLELIAKGYPLIAVLESVVLGMEAESAGARCSILLMSEDGKSLCLGAAPSLPETYNQLVNQVAIGPRVGSCGTAAFRQQRVIVADIATDPLWGGVFREQALALNLRACWSEPIFSSNGQVLGTFAIYHDHICMPQEQDVVQIRYAANLASIAIEHDQARRELEYQARMDFLTGVPNRRYFVECAEQELHRSQQQGLPLSLLMLDVDFFKRVNDRYGHKAGDVVLQRLTQCLQGHLRQLDVLGRLGGEEFAILLPETSLEEAMGVAERLRQAVAEDVVKLDRHDPFSITISIGVSLCTQQDQSLDQPLRRADKALYAAKQSGRNRVCVEPVVR